MTADVADVGCLVGDLDALCPHRQCGCLLDLPTLAFGAWEGHVVGHLEHERGHVSTEFSLQFLGGRVSVLEGIVQDGSLEHGHVGNATVGRDERRDFDRVVDVWRLVASLAPLITMFVGGEGDGAQ